MSDAPTTGGGAGALSGRTALVTGAASGIGAAIAEAFAAAGADLCLADRSQGPGLDEVAHSCVDAGAKVVTVRADVSVEADVAHMFEVAGDGLGSVEILVNNAGIVTEGPVREMSTEMWDQMMAVNLRSVFLCCRAAVPSMLESGFGRIINIASQVGQRGGAGLAHYAAAKAGVVGFTKSLARELGSSGVTANCIAPGPIETALGGNLSEEWKSSLKAGLPLGRFGLPDEVAPTAVLLASDPGGNIYTGQTLGPNSGDVML